eukprot:Awhi_evm1s327
MDNGINVFGHDHIQVDQTQTSLCALSIHVTAEPDKYSPRLVKNNGKEFGVKSRPGLLCEFFTQYVS